MTQDSAILPENAQLSETRIAMISSNITSLAPSAANVQRRAPIVSVITPTFNRQASLFGAISSVLKQTIGIENVEIIIVDDCSTDSTVSILDTFVAAFPGVITVHRNERNIGPGGSRNAGIRLARGKYLFFLDSDDTLNHHALERMVQCAEENDNDIVVGKLCRHDGSLWAPTVFAEQLISTNIYESKLYWTLGPVKLFRRSLVMENGLYFDETVKSGEDQLFVSRAYFLSRTVSILTDIAYVHLGVDDTNIHRAKHPVGNLVHTASALLAVIDDLCPKEMDASRFKIRHFRQQIVPFIKKCNAGKDNISGDVIDVVQKLIESHCDARVEKRLKANLSDWEAVQNFRMSPRNQSRSCAR